MDPLSLTFGVAGLVSLAQVVVKEGYNYIRTAKDAREDIRNLINEVAGLSGVLEGLKLIVDDLGKACDSPGITKHQQVSDCEDVLQHLRELLQKINPTTKTKKTSIFQRKMSQPQNSSLTPEDKKTSIIERIKEIIDNTGKMSTWPLSKDETMELVSRLSRHKATFILALSADNTAMLIKVLDEARQASYHLVDIRSEQDRVAEEKRKEDRMAKLCWLFPGDPDEKHIDIRQRRHKGTGSWLFDTEKFKKWLREPYWLFCHGKAGAGKTVLTSAAIDHIADKITAMDGLAHIYCGFKDREEQTPTKIFASILRQLSFQKSKLPSEIELLHKKFTSTGKTPQLEDLVQAIISLARSFSRVWLFFDALDECSKTTLEVLLSRIQDLMKTDIKGFVTSRSHVLDIQNTFENSIKMKLSAHDQDIEIFVRSRLSTRARLSDRLVDNIVSRVLEEADGIFLLAAFHVEFIIKKKRSTDMRNCLNRLPIGLNGIYENILYNIKHDDEDNKALALKALSWISHATRPLRPKELIEALTVVENDSAIEDEDFDEKDLVDVCGGLVMIDENSETVRFVHYTVQEHLDNSLDVPRGAHVHAMMVKICLTYLSFDAFDGYPRNGMDTRWLVTRLDNNAFYEYAACNWGYHTKSSNKEKSVVEMICTFSGIGNRMESALHVFLSKDLLFTRRNHKLHSSRNALFMAAIIGLPHLAESLVRLGNIEVDLKDKNCDKMDRINLRTPLSRAAEYGHLGVVQLLLDRNDVVEDSEDSNSQTPLSWAAQNGHLAVVELLVNRDNVKADSRDSDYGQTPLSWAARNGHLAVVELLANRDNGEADSKDSNGQTPLSLAAENGHLAVVELLLSRDDVEANSKDNDYGQTPLSWAARNGHLAVVELLVERDDVGADSKNSNGQTPLALAAENGHLAVVELLVKRDDVEADSKDSNGRTPLTWAAWSGHLAVVELLVNRDDVQADSKDNYDDQTPLSWAARSGHLAVVELLANRDDVEADSKGKWGRTPLSWAAQGGHHAVVELLVNRDDVRADPKDSNGRTPLSLAAENGHLEVVGLLVNRDDVKINSKDKWGRTPLSWAKQSEVVELLS